MTFMCEYNIKKRSAWDIIPRKERPNSKISKPYFSVKIDNKNHSLKPTNQKTSKTKVKRSMGSKYALELGFQKR